ncbi:MAG TPA: response regulator [Segetibacter sp.]|jgi:CheY-like chemotaxis protein
MLSNIKNVVIADDDQDDVDIFQEAVVKVSCNVNVTVAKDGQKLFEILHEMPKPDAILLDLNMPSKSGKECLEEIRAIDGFAEVPILILSTSNYKEDVRFCLEKGANGYYVKPQNFSGMLQIAKDICSRYLN